jgi:hypothetical protein
MILYNKILLDLYRSLDVRIIILKMLQCAGYVAIMRGEETHLDFKAENS